MQKLIKKTLIVLSIILFFAGLCSAQSFISESNFRIQQINFNTKNQSDKLTTVKMAKIMGMQPYQINDILAGKSMPIGTKLKRWATMLRCTAVRKIGKDGYPYIGLECDQIYSKETGKEVQTDDTTTI